MGVYLNSRNPFGLFQDEATAAYFIDKSGILEELIPLVDGDGRYGASAEKSNKYICVTRPRRFGKTLAACMIASFFGSGIDSRDLFQRLKIGKSKQFEAHINKHQVICISFNEIPSSCTSYQQYIFRIEKRLRNDLRKAYPEAEISEEDAIWDILSGIYETEEQVRFIFVLDEWDYIFHRTFVTDRDKAEFLEFLSNLLKGKSYVELAYMTGILPIAKYSSGSELNMFYEYTMASEEKYSEYFGFTDWEVDELFRRYQSRHLERENVTREGLRMWYDGYHTKSGERVYNPRSVVAALTNNNLGNYWTSAGPYDEIFYYVKENTAAVRDDLALLASGMSVHAKVREYAATSMSLNTKDEIFSAMVVYGFLNYEDGCVSIPNKELMDRFSDMIQKEPSLGYVHRLAEESDRMLQATKAGDTDTFPGLLRLLTDRWQTYRISHPSPSGNYNIFRILEVSEKEVVMCRMLADLLNPAGAHRKGSVYLYHFLREVLKARVTEDDLNSVQVEKEYLIPGTERRIDIAVYTGRYFLPIEVKIHAGEQRSQCYDYYQYAKERNAGGDARVCYLTIDGKLPSEYSLSRYDQDGNVTDRIGTENIIPVSFRRHVAPWLRKLLFHEPDGPEGEEREILMQYLQAIEEVTGAAREESQEVVAGTLLETEAYFRMGLQIADAADTAKAALIRKVMEEFRLQMEPVSESYHLEEEHAYSYYTYENQATEEFYALYSTYPGINYRVAKLDERYELWFRIEVEHHLFAGFCVFDCERESEYDREASGASGGNGEAASEPEGSESGPQPSASGPEKTARGDKMVCRTCEIERRLTDFLEIQRIDCRINNWWVKWVHLPTGSCQTTGSFERVPDFKHMNEAAIRLADEEKRRAFVAECVTVIRRTLLSLLKTVPEQGD